MTNTRYEPGKEYAFVDVIYDRPEPMFTSLYVPWSDTLKEIVVRRMKCVEHHRVPGDWDDEPKYDGFIFQDTEGDEERWYNQYPRASYGQATDDGNWKIRVAEDRNGVRLTEEAADRYSDTEILWGVQDASKYLDTIHDGINPRQSRNELESDQKAALQDFYDQLKQAVEEKMGCQFELEEWIAQPIDKSKPPVHTGILHHVMRDPAPTLAP